MIARYMYHNVWVELYRLLKCFDPSNEKIKEIQPRSILVYGISGIGKTTLVEQHIDHAGLICSKINSTVLDGETTLADALNEIENMGALVTVIDDLEQIVTEEDVDSKSERYLMIRNFILNMSKNGNLVIAIANDLFYGRTKANDICKFEYQIAVPWRRGNTPLWVSEKFWKDKLDDSVDEDAIASIFAGLSTDEMEEIYKKKRIYGIGDYNELYEYKRILNATVEVLFGIPYLLSEAPEDIEKQRYENAVYEAGRIVVSEMTKPGSVRISTIHRLPGENGGKTQRYESFESRPTMKQNEDEVMYLLAGKAAIDVVYGQVDATCADDLKKAFKIVYDRETQLCPNGFEVYSMNLNSRLAPRMFCCETIEEFQCPRVNEHSVHMQEMIEATVSTTMKALYEKTCKLIENNRSFFDALVYHLADSYTITQLEISRMYIESSKKKRWFLNKMEG